MTFTSESLQRLFVDFFGYMVFILASYVMFSTDMRFRYFLIPVTVVAFFYTLNNRYVKAFEEGFAACEGIFEDPDDDETEIV